MLGRGVLGKGRFELRGALGAGAFGAVYAALDRERQALVAIKRPHVQAAESLVRFKREFRALADLSHPNLVALHELFEEEGMWFYAMELVDGAPLTSVLRRGLDPATEAAPTAPGPLLDALGMTFQTGPEGSSATLVPPPPTERSALLLDTGELDEADAEDEGEEPEPARPPDLDLLRACFAQLVSAVDVIHAAGMLHRDLKPSNVLVTPQGRVVVLDFGLIAYQTRPGSELDRSVAGTPAYMSPEQWLGEPVSADSDWYSVGVMLYECMTGSRPFHGELFDMMGAKTQGSFLPPRARCPELPAELDAACCDLLDPRPEVRRRGAQALREATAGAGATAPTPAPGGRVFVGRERELGALEEAFRATARGAAGCVHVAGESGYGKTSLCEEFIARVHASGAALVLRGRCHEQESVPYKALDAAIDELSQELRRREGAAARLRPADAGALVQTFAVLERAFGAADGSYHPRGPANPVATRQRAFRALRELLRRLAGERPVVLWLDDVQWGDADSATVLHGLVRPPDAPRLLVVLSYRNDEGEPGAFLRELRALELDAGAPAPVRRISLGPLPDDASRAMVAALSAEAPPRLEVERILREAGGVPIFLDQLARFRRGGASGPDSFDTSGDPDSERRGELLARLVQRHLAALPAASRTVVELAAVAGAPLELEVLRAASGLPALDRAVLQPLRLRHLVRLRSAEGHELLAPYHAKIAAVVAAELSPAQRRARHAALAAALAGAGAPPRLIAGHFHAAGELREAGAFVRTAAQRAAAALAFEEAAECYALALAWDPGDPGERRALRRRFADALVYAGRLREAAPVYLDLVEGAGPSEALELKRLAAEQLLASGSIDEGEALFREVAEAHGIGLPEGRGRAMLALGYGVARLKLRGTGFTPRAASTLDPALVARIDAAYAGARNFAQVRLQAAVHFAVQALRLALDAGDLQRIPEGLAVVGASLALAGDPHGRRLVQQACEMAEQLGAPHVRGAVDMWHAFVEHTDFRWEPALSLWDEAAALLSECPGFMAEQIRARGLSLLPLQHLGRFDAIELRTAALLANAHETGNVYAEITGLTYSALPLLARGDVLEARRRVGEAGARTPRGLFTALSRMKMLAHCELYRGDSAEALRRLDAAEPEIEAARMRTVGHFRITVGSFHAGCALQALAEGAPDRKAMLKRARRELARFADLAKPFAQAAAAAVRAGLAAAEGRPGLAVDEMRRALEIYSAQGHALERAYAERRLGGLLGGAEGRRLIAGADAALRLCGISDPERWVTSFFPGLPG